MAYCSNGVYCEDMTTTTADPFVIADTIEILIADGWTPTWAACKNSVKDEYGNKATLHNDDDSIAVVFEYALGGIVETLHLDPNHGATRIARVVSVLSDAPDE